VVRLRFEWDESKNQNNLRKHGVDFYTASLAFEDPHQVVVFDRVVDGEQRWKLLGAANGSSLLVVAHTYRDGDEEVVRIISARQAERFERRNYEDNL
jgi:uncharacterized DUF497 family protein